MSAAERLNALDSLPATELCARAEAALTALVDVMNRETVLLRAGRYRDSATLTADKTRLAQDYVGFARSVQRQAERLKREAPGGIAALKAGHERLATQMAENLRVIATARMVTEDLLGDVAKIVGQKQKTSTYGVTGQPLRQANDSARGIAINRAL